MTVLQKNKKLAAGIGVAAAAAAVLAVGAGTYASFVDTENAPTSTYAAGTLNLEVGGSATTNDITFENVAPGFNRTEKITFRNTGTVDGTLSLAFSFTSSENGCAEPENEVPANCTATGNLQNALVVAVNGNRVGTVAQLAAGGAVQPVALNAGKDATFDITVSVDKNTVGNEIMTDQVALSAVATLNQS
jgi:predicted ribosomally synthesized peptide with SipW-like signal peptide